MKYPSSCREDQRLSPEGKIVSKYCNISKNSRGGGGGWGPSTPPPACTTLGIGVCVYVRTKFVLLVSFTLIKTICSKIWAKLNQCQRMQKVDVRSTCVAQKRLCLSSVMLTEGCRYSEVRGVSIQFFGDLPNIF